MVALAFAFHWRVRVPLAHVRRQIVAALLWRHRDHGYRDGYKWTDEQITRWGGTCRRCGGYQFDEPRHPRGMVGPDGWLR